MPCSDPALARLPVLAVAGRRTRGGMLGAQVQFTNDPTHVHYVTHDGFRAWHLHSTTEVPNAKPNTAELHRTRAP